MNIRYLIGLSFIMGCLGCTEDPKNFIIENTNYPKKIDISMVIKDISIPIDSSYNLTYSISGLTRINDDDIFAGYNRKTHSLDLLNISQRKPLGHIKLYKIGPNMVDDFYGSLEVRSLDSIIMFDADGLKFVNSKGLVFKRYKMGKFHYDKYEGRLASSAITKFQYNDKRQTIVTYFQAKDLVKRRKKGLDEPMLAEYNLSSQQMTKFPGVYSEYIKHHNGRFSYDIVPNVSFNGDKIIYNFPVESNIYIYDNQLKKLNIKGGKSKFSKNLSVPLKKGGNHDEYRITNPIFLPVIYDKYKKLHYRMHWGDQPIKVSETNYNSMITKPAYLMLFDEHFNLINETKINREKYFPDNGFITSEGLFVWGDPIKNDRKDIIKLGLYKIEMK